MPRNVPGDPALTQFQPGDSAMTKMLKVTRWALQRGGRFTAPELMARFGTTKSMAYAYTKQWRAVFGTEPPPRASRYAHKNGLPPSPKGKPKVSLDSLL